MLVKSEFPQETSNTQGLGKPFASEGAATAAFQKEFQNHLLRKPQKSGQAYQNQQKRVEQSSPHLEAMRLF